jgi:hypothetical protein
MSATDAETANTITLILSSARLLFGRHQTYDVVTSQGAPPTPNTPLPVARAFFIGYSVGTSPPHVGQPEHKGRVLKVVSTGLGDFHRVAAALQVLAKWCREEVKKHEGSMAVGREFEGPVF